MYAYAGLPVFLLWRAAWTFYVPLPELGRLRLSANRALGQAKRGCEGVASIEEAWVAMSELQRWPRGFQ